MPMIFKTAALILSFFICLACTQKTAPSIQASAYINEVLTIRDNWGGIRSASRAWNLDSLEFSGHQRRSSASGFIIEVESHVKNNPWESDEPWIALLSISSDRSLTSGSLDVAKDNIVIIYSGSPSDALSSVMCVAVAESGTVQIEKISRHDGRLTLDVEMLTDDGLSQKQICHAGRWQLSVDFAWPTGTANTDNTGRRQNQSPPSHRPKY
jgi:hypothetical protein